MKHRLERLVQPLIFIILLVVPAKASAMTLYLETGLGTSMFFNGPGLWTSGPASSNLGVAANFFLGWNLGGPTAPVQLHLGIMNRHITGGSNGITYGMNTTYPVIRVETYRVYMGGGASPTVFTTSDPQIFTSNLEYQSGKMGAMLEIGLMWRVVPFFHIVLGGAAQTTIDFANNFTIGPYIWDATLNLRFMLLGATEDRSSGRGGRSGKNKRSDGWRYPFGIMKNR